MVAARPQKQPKRGKHAVPMRLVRAKQSGGSAPRAAEKRSLPSFLARKLAGCRAEPCGLKAARSAAQTQNQENSEALSPALFEGI